MKPLRDAMRREAGRIWRDKARAGKLGLFLNEETITETTLLNLASNFYGRGLSVQLFTKAEEKKNGADWELWFFEGNRAVALRVQAKRLFPGGLYNSLNPGGSQINALISRAGICCPVYIFYNDEHAYPSRAPGCSCGDYHAPSYLGCTLAPASAVVRAGSNSASSLQGSAIPWHCLLCDRVTKKTSMLDVITDNLNRHLKANNGQPHKVVEVPSDLQSYTTIPGQQFPGLFYSDQYREPAWLKGYLSENELAGIALVGEQEHFL